MTALFYLGLRKQKDRARNTKKLIHFFQENNSTISTSGKYNKPKDKGSSKNSTKIKTPGDKYKQGLNETYFSNTTRFMKHTKHDLNISQDEKNQKAAIRRLLCNLFNITKENESCKDKHHSKKAMIWPTKMLPWLKTVLINKLNRAENNRMSFLDSMEDPTESPFGGELANGISDNWDGNPLQLHRKHRHGLKMVPLLKTLKAKLFGQKSPSDVGSLNDALNGEGLNGFGPMPTQGSSHLIHQILRQALGSSDRNSVLNEMRQELNLASDRGESEGNEGFDDLTGRNSLGQFNNGLQGSPIMPAASQSVGIGQLGGVNMLQGNMRTPFMEQTIRRTPLMEQPIHAQMLDNGAIAPMPRQPVFGSALKTSSFLDNSPIGRSPLIGSPLRIPRFPGLPISSPTSRSSLLQSSFQEAPPGEGSLLQRAGGFNLPMSSSLLEHASTPTQRMYTDSVEEMPDFTSHQDNFIEPNEPEERHSPRLRPQPRPRPLGNNMVMEEISDTMARGRNLPMQANPDLDRLMKLRSGFRSTGNPTSSRSSRLDFGSNYENGLRLPVDSNSLGMASVLSKDEDSINFKDLNAQRSLSFRRGKVLKVASHSHALPTKKSSSQHHKDIKRKPKNGA